MALGPNTDLHTSTHPTTPKQAQRLRLLLLSISFFGSVNPSQARMLSTLSRRALASRGLLGAASRHVRPAAASFHSGGYFYHACVTCLMIEGMARMVLWGTRGGACLTPSSSAHPMMLLLLL